MKAEATDGKAREPLALASTDGLGVTVLPFEKAARRRMKKGAVVVVDDGSPGYLDGVECQYSVHVATGRGPGEYRTVAYVFDRADALRIAAMLMTPNVGIDAGRTAAKDE